MKSGDIFNKSQAMTTFPCTVLKRARELIYLYETDASPGEATRVAFMSDEFDTGTSRDYVTMYG